MLKAQSVNETCRLELADPDVVHDVRRHGRSSASWRTVLKLRICRKAYLSAANAVTIMYIRYHPLGNATSHYCFWKIST